MSTESSTYAAERAAALDESRPIAVLIDYVRRSYLPNTPTARLLAAYEALEAEHAALRQGLGLMKLDDDARAGVARLSQ